LTTFYFSYFLVVALKTQAANK